MPPKRRAKGRGFGGDDSDSDFTLSGNTAKKSKVAMAELSELKCLSCGYFKPLADYDASQMAKVPFRIAVKCKGCMDKSVENATKESVENAKKLKCSDCGKLDADFSKTQKKKAKHGYAKCKDCTAKGNGGAVKQVLTGRQELEARKAQSSIDDDSTTTEIDDDSTQQSNGAINDVGDNSPQPGANDNGANGNSTASTNDNDGDNSPQPGTNDDSPKQPNGSTDDGGGDGNNSPKQPNGSNDNGPKQPNGSTNDVDNAGADKCKFCNLQFVLEGPGCDCGAVALRRTVESLSDKGISLTELLGISSEISMGILGPHRKVIREKVMSDVFDDIADTHDAYIKLMTEQGLLPQGLAELMWELYGRSKNQSAEFYTNKILAEAGTMNATEIMVKKIVLRMLGVDLERSVSE
jgi:hypothetical protein